MRSTHAPALLCAALLSISALSPHQAAACIAIGHPTVTENIEQFIPLAYRQLPFVAEYNQVSPPMKVQAATPLSLATPDDSPQRNAVQKLYVRLMMALAASR